MRRILGMIAALAAAQISAQAQTSFTRGHIFVVVTESEACEFGGFEWIVEIDPDTGDSWVFADSNDGLCGVSGLRFTPDGTRLLAVNYGTFASGTPDGGWVQAFNPDGTNEIILDATDGLQSPTGTNALAFDAGGNLYLVSGDSSYILRFNGLNGPPTIFADSSDGVSFRGALDFAPSGNLYYARFSGGILQFAPDGQPSTFYTTGTRSLAVDRYGNVFTAGGGGVARYDCEDSATRHLIVSGIVAQSMMVGVSHDSTLLYLVANGIVYVVDPVSGNPIVFADLTYLSALARIPLGITVYWPSVPSDVDVDTDVDLADVAIFQNCQHIVVNSHDCSCVPSDLNRDAQYDLLDWVLLASTLSGPQSAEPK